MKNPTTVVLALCVAYYFDQYAQFYAALLLLLVGIYALFDLLPPRLAPRARDLGRLTVVTLIVMMLVVVPTLLQVQTRRMTDSNEHIHDGALQTEAAINFLLDGKNPYTENYTQTPMAQWPQYLGLPPSENVALLYLPYFPLTFILPAPFYLAAQAGLGFFDLRLYQIILFVILFFLLRKVTPDRDQQILVMTTVSLNPLFVPFFIEGRNDIIVLLWLVAAIVLLRRGHISAAALAVGLASAVKATALFILPFFLIHLWQTSDKNMRHFLRAAILPLATPVVIVFVPFLLWNTNAFIANAVWYQSSGYQIWGQGFSRLLLDVGILADKYAAFPFSTIQFLFGVPVLIGLVRWQMVQPTVQRMLAATAVLGGVVGFWGRAFADNHIGFILSVALIAAFIGPVPLGESQREATR